MKRTHLHTFLYVFALFALLFFHFICEYASAQSFTGAALQNARAWDYTFLGILYGLWSFLFGRHLKSLRSSNFYN